MIVIFLTILNAIFPLPPLPDFSRAIYSSNKSLLTAYLTKDDKWRMRTKISEVSPDLIKSIIAKEDRWFFYHPGINVFSVLRAAFLNISTGKIVSGASTITMQTARLLEPA